MNEELKDSTLKKQTSSQTIPPNRLVLYAFLAGALPLVLALFVASHRINTASEELATTLFLQEQALSSLQVQRTNRTVLYSFQEKDPFYVSKQLESYQPLKREITVLEQLQTYTGLPDVAAQEKRYKFLTSGDNGFAFIESAAMISPLMKETVETQNKHVEVDEEDLMAILNNIEGTQDKESPRPDLIVIDGSIERKKGYDKEVWALSVKLVKRIYTKRLRLIEETPAHETHS